MASRTVELGKHYALRMRSPGGTWLFSVVHDGLLWAEIRILDSHRYARPTEAEALLFAIELWLYSNVPSILVDANFSVVREKLEQLAEEHRRYQASQPATTTQ